MLRLRARGFAPLTENPSWDQSIVRPPTAQRPEIDRAADFAKSYAEDWEAKATLALPAASRLTARQHTPQHAVAQHVMMEQRCRCMHASQD